MSKGQNNLTVQIHVRVICPENMKHLLCIASKYWPCQDLDIWDGWDGGGNDNIPPAKIWLRGKNHLHVFSHRKAHEPHSQASVRDGGLQQVCEGKCRFWC